MVLVVVIVNVAITIFCVKWYNNKSELRIISDNSVSKLFLLRSENETVLEIIDCGREIYALNFKNQQNRENLLSVKIDVKNSEVIQCITKTRDNEGNTLIYNIRNVSRQEYGEFNPLEFNKSPKMRQPTAEAKPIGNE